MERAIGYNAYKLDRDSNFFAKQLAAANWQKSEKAIMWAVENGITKGTTDTTFSPNAVCTRAQIVVFLYRASGDDAPNLKLQFTDVPANAWCAEAVAWAVSKGITNGTTATTFSPNATCTRAQAVTFIYRAQ